MNLNISIKITSFLVEWPIELLSVELTELLNIELVEWMSWMSI